MSTISYATRNFTIPAGGSADVSRAADFMSCLEASKPFKVAFQDGSQNDFEAGLTYNAPQGFSRVSFINPNDVEITIKVAFGRGDIADSRLNLVGAEMTVRADVPLPVVASQALPVVAESALPVRASETLPTKAVSPSVVKTAQVTCGAGWTVICAANAGRSEVTVFLQAEPALSSGQIAGVSGSGQTPAFPLPEGGSITLQTSDAVHFWNGGSGNAVVNLIWTEFV